MAHRFEQTVSFSPIVQVLYLVALGVFVWVQLQAVPDLPWIPLLIGAGLVILPAMFGRLVFQVDEEGVTARFGYPGWLAQRVPLSRIERARIVSYRPIRQFGGWGIPRRPFRRREDEHLLGTGDARRPPGADRGPAHQRRPDAAVSARKRRIRNDSRRLSGNREGSPMLETLEAARQPSPGQGRCAHDGATAALGPCRADHWRRPPRVGPKRTCWRRSQCSSRVD